MLRGLLGSPCEASVDASSTNWVERSSHKLTVVEAREVINVDGGLSAHVYGAVYGSAGGSPSTTDLNL